MIGRSAYRTAAVLALALVTAPVREINGAPVLWAPHAGFQTAFTANGAFECLGGGSAGPGKGLALDTPLPTPRGWTTMGDVCVGDTLYDERGRPCRVTLVQPVEHRPCYRIRFDDDSEIVADDVHQWSVLSPKVLVAQTRQHEDWREARRLRRPSRAVGSSLGRGARNAYYAAVARSDRPRVPDPWMGATVMNTAALASWTGRRLAIPVADALETAETAADTLPIHPYVLGAWLGDGTSASGGFTCDDRQPWTVEQIRHYGYSVAKHRSLNAYNILGLVTTLRTLGLLNNKHIPPSYLRASIGSRRLLLAGLLDTDGCVNKDGTVELTTVSPQLAKDYYEVVVSLGYKPTIKTKVARCQTGAESLAYRIMWSGASTPVTAPWKAARLPQRNRPSIRRRFIEAVTPVPSVPTRCIAVDSASRLFLAGTAMVPTHNTSALIALAAGHAQHPKARALFLRTVYRDMLDVRDRMQALYPRLGAEWQASDARWVFPSGGMVMLGHGATMTEIGPFLGPEFSAVFWDELSLVPQESVWQMLLTRVRTTDPTIRLMARASANPIGPGRAWLKSRFIDPCGLRGERVYRDPDTGRTRAYVPGTSKDNPSLPSDYWRGLADLPPSIIAALRDGLWDSELGLFYPELAGDQSRFWVTAAQLPPLLDRYEFWAAYDWGFSHPAAFAWFTRIKSVVYWRDTVYLHRYQDEEQAATIKGLADPRCLRTVYAGHDAFARRMAHSAAAETVADVFDRYGIRLERAVIDRAAGAKAVRRYLAEPKPGPMPKGVVTLRIVDTPGNRRAVGELALLVPEDGNEQVPAKRDANEKGLNGDDGADVARYGLASPSFEPLEPPSAQPWDRNVDDGVDHDFERIMAQRDGGFRLTETGAQDRREYVSLREHGPTDPDLSQFPDER